MNTKDHTMMDGYEDLDHYWAKTRLSPLKMLRVHSSAIFITIFKFVIKPIRFMFGKSFDLLANIDNDLGKFDILGTKRQEQEGENYLTQSQIEKFSESGVHGPFRVIDQKEAKKLAGESDDLFKNHFHKTTLFGDDILDSLKAFDDYSINYLGYFQGSKYQKLWNVLVHPKIAQPLQSILGDDLLCWRSQFFEKKPGQEGTFWHQTGTFRESDGKPKLEPTQPTHPALAQLTVWIALRDTNKKTGCLRVVEGSFTDGRFERIVTNIQDDLLGYLMSLPYSEIIKTLKTIWYTTGNFKKAQLIFEKIKRTIPSLFENITIRDLEMKAGEAIIFTSLNTHASYANTSDDQIRLALAGRYTRSDVHIFKHESTSILPTKGGGISYDVHNEPSIPVAGNPKSPKTNNNIAEYPLV
ncbi:phytanoyl-CoA dioxygenase family protein [Aquimarina aquimarini]|uniref:phytanoyl-CoA dioxygenase family protein n=1 Tax=Aquimarina aquimarini TaxID=1191734 RepID=UPI001F38C853|nr:phytanoyl-CoA dioxygenase family protein [Aquimarina aquimarini]